MSARWTLYCVPLSKTFISASSEGTQRMSELRARQNVSSLQHSEQNAKCWSLVPGQHAAASFPHRSRVYTTPERKTQLKKKTHTILYIFKKNPHGQECISQVGCTPPQTWPEWAQQPTVVANHNIIDTGTWSQT